MAAADVPQYDEGDLAVGGGGGGDKFAREREAGEEAAVLQLRRLTFKSWWFEAGAYTHPLFSST